MMRPEGFFGLLLIVGVVYVASGLTDPNDVRILKKFKKGLENSELLKWPENGDDPCGPPLWPHVYCNGNRVSQIQVQNMGLRGTLPDDLNQLSRLSNVGLQKNNFTGKLPTFNGLSELQFAYLDYNHFDTIPWDFFNGLSNLHVLALDSNPLNATTGWFLPHQLSNSVQLINLSLMYTNLVGPVPEFLGLLPSLTVLKLSYNNLSGSIPLSFNQSALRVLWLNNQSGDDDGLSGSIEVIAGMPSLTQVWIHGNKFNGTIPNEIGSLTSLKELRLNSNSLVGVIPKGLAKLELDVLDLSNNFLMGPIPTFKSVNVSYENNRFCSSDPGTQCDPEVNALIDFLAGLDYPLDLGWSGNNPCEQWLGIGCDPSSTLVTVINLPNRELNGTLSPSLAKISSLLEIRLQRNRLGGHIPLNFTKLKSLRLLDLSRNNFEPPLPKFHSGIKVYLAGNPLLGFPSPGITPPMSSDSPTEAPGRAEPPVVTGGGPGAPPPGIGSNGTLNIPMQRPPAYGKSNLVKLVVTLAAITSVASALLVLILGLICFRKRKKPNMESSTSAVIPPRDPLDPDNEIKIAVSSSSVGSMFTQTNSSTLSGHSGSAKSGNLSISVQMLRKVTNNFATENQLGRGGFGVVYMGELEDGMKIAVKRMEVMHLGDNVNNEFHAEISVLSTVRHRHLVSLYGYSTEGYEKLLIYEYMSQGALSKHLFQWRSFGLKPLSWQSRLVIALDVARGMEYLHSLAHHSFIHRDLKSSNILLDDSYRAKVADFGLVKLAPDGVQSFATKLAGTFGYLAPEYAVTGKASTKVDVFSFGVVLIEVITGLVALDENRSEEKRYLVEWFWQIKSSKVNLVKAIDTSMEINEEALESINIVVDLAGHCTARDPYHRPDMGHVVSVLSPLVEKWKPFDEEEGRLPPLDMNSTLPIMLNKWKTECETTGYSFSNSVTESHSDSTVSMPTNPSGSGFSLVTCECP